jgi:hypothetical protein
MIETQSTKQCLFFSGSISEDMESLFQLYYGKQFCSLSVIQIRLEDIQILISKVSLLKYLVIENYNSFRHFKQQFLLLI